MFLTLAFHHNLIKWILPASFLVFSIPAYLLHWLLIRVLSLPIPKRFYNRMDNVLFELFTKQIVYFLLRSTPAKVILMIEYNLNMICNPNI